MDEYATASFTAWRNATVDAGTVDLPEDSTVDVAHSQAWSDVPDVVEGDLGELAAPFGGDTDTTAESGDLVAES